MGLLVHAGATTTTSSETQASLSSLLYSRPLLHWFGFPGIWMRLRNIRLNWIFLISYLIYCWSGFILNCRCRRRRFHNWSCFNQCLTLSSSSRSHMSLRIFQDRIVWSVEQEYSLSSITAKEFTLDEWPVHLHVSMSDGWGGRCRKWGEGYEGWSGRCGRTEEEEVEEDDENEEKDEEIVKCQYRCKHLFVRRSHTRTELSIDPAPEKSLVPPSWSRQRAYTAPTWPASDRTYSFVLRSHTST